MTRPNRAAPSSWASRLCYPYQHQHHAYCYWYAQGTTMLCHLSGESLSWGRGVLRKKDDMIVGSREHLEVFYSLTESPIKRCKHRRTPFNISPPKFGVDVLGSVRLYGVPLHRLPMSTGHVGTVCTPQFFSNPPCLLR